MSFDVSKLKSISNSTLSTLAAKEARSGSNFVDDRFWTPTRDANGNARVVIRILPSIRAGELPWAEQWNYAIKGPGGWYIETSRRTIGQPDPMAEYISQRWREAQTESDKNALRAAGLSKARHTFIANILIVNDPDHPENNGKVKLWKFGQKIYEMITDMAKPDPFDETKGGINVTDWDNGCNFKLIVHTVDRFPRYDKSSFDQPSSIGDDARIVQIADQMYDLSEFTDPSKIKSYDELKARVDRVFGLNNGGTQPAVNFEYPARATPAAPVTPASGPTSTIVTAPATVNPQQVVKPVVQPTQNTATTAPWEDDLDLDELLKDI